MGAHDGTREAVYEREIAFHDALAAKLDPGRMGVDYRDAFDPVVLREIGDVAGKRVLDVGCGDGTLSLVMARAGAQVTAFDLSPGMVEVARRRAELHLGPDDHPVEFLVGPFEEIEVPDGVFDLVVGKFILHHVDLDTAAARVNAWLRPGGTGYFLETSALNPLLIAARKLIVGRFGVARFGTADEHPLGGDDIRRFTASFAKATVDHPTVWFLRMIDRHVLRSRWPRTKRALIAADERLGRHPRLARLSYYVAIRVQSTQVR